MTDTPATPQQAEEYLVDLADLAERAGIDLGPGVASGHEAIANCRRWRRELQKQAENRSTAIKRIARALASGDLDLDGAITEAARVDQLAPGSITYTACMMAEDVAATRAFARLGRELDTEAVFAEARSIVADAIEAIRKLRPTLDGIRNADAAAVAGPAKAKAWAEYRAVLLPRFDAAHALVKRLRELGWLEPLAPELARFAMYGRHDLYVADVKAGRRAKSRVLPLLDERSDAWLPHGPATQAEAKAAAKVVEAELGPLEPTSTAIRVRAGMPA